MAVFTRRQIVASALALPVLALPACATIAPFLFEDGIRRLLTLSSQRAFARLVEQDGFLDDQLTRIPLPPEFSRAGAVGSALLRTPVIQDQLLRLMNRAAANAAETAAPIVMDSIRSMTISDALSLARGGPTAATDFLERTMGNRIVDAMFPTVGNALRLFDDNLLGPVLGAATGIDFAGLQRHVASSAARSLYRAIGREEAGIRADPRSTGDPVIVRMFG